ncbi:MAG: class I SAM-dependent methyltransferase [Myxococcales bacterium]|nr:class I SAM-dependent methyltransferase [Myxococcales bacterium]
MSGVSGDIIVDGLAPRIPSAGTWRLFEQAAGGYDEWYDSPSGRRVERSERRLLRWLLDQVPGSRSLLDVGCGTGRFTGWLAERPLRVFGLDRSPAMLAVLRRRHPEVPVVLGDAHRLPLRDGAVDLTLLLTTLEFLEDPLAALTEAVRVSRRGMLLVVLNRWSMGGLSRRVGRQRSGSLLGRARDWTVAMLRAAARKAAGRRLRATRWRSALLPGGLADVPTMIPLGDVLGLVVRLDHAGDRELACLAASSRSRFTSRPRSGGH